MTRPMDFCSVQIRIGGSVRLDVGTLFENCQHAMASSVPSVPVFPSWCSQVLSKSWDSSDSGFPADLIHEIWWGVSPGIAAVIGAGSLRSRSVPGVFVEGVHFLAACIHSSRVTGICCPKMVLVVLDVDPPEHRHMCRIVVPSVYCRC